MGFGADRSAERGLQAASGHAVSLTPRFSAVQSGRRVTSRFNGFLASAQILGGRTQEGNGTSETGPVWL